ncbi:hypothetical protein [Flavobacterium proteolyticum]|uniref:Lipoprotein n=1 Tax=Flavobacterium proteolyticum TaxID=2911683 RepID=A0ABR9WUW4_9FLAO|nr:hypothetical protein [Flavobacterium proteolyticum]MBE9577419.1 hypothetical protein [Flavobacterium proteolyticum]
MERLIKFFILFLILLLTGCLHQEKIQGFIKVEDEITADTIESVTINRGILTLNKKYTLFSNCFLIYKDSFPKWIEDYGEPDIKSDDYFFEPFITDIKPPYVIYKFKNEKYFYIIKNNDTLKFELGDF